MNYAARLDKLSQLLKKLRCEAIVITQGINVRYLTGFTGTSGAVIVTQGGKRFFITDFRYRTQAASQTGDHSRVVIAEKGLWKEAARILKREGCQRIGFEAEHTSVSVWEEIKAMVKPAETVPTTRVVEDMRIYKDDDEIAVIREAVRIADETMAYAISELRPGRTELEIAALIEAKIRELGGQGNSFGTGDVIVASGTRSALPHGVASSKTMEQGELVTLDLGAKFNGYCSDMTRTVCLGKASPNQKEIYALTYEAQVAASAAIKPGLSCKAADKVARDIIADRGLEAEFGHGLGHGVGMDIHEQPRLSKLGKGKLAPGLVITVEPGIYIPEWGGVRIEDMLLVTEDGSEVLTQTPKPETLLEV